MPERDKVIKGLEHCRKTSCESCPYNATDVKNSNPTCLINEMLSDALALLKRQEGIVPYIDIDEAKCPVCKVKLTRQELIGDDVLFEDFFDYCPHCGKPILWEGR